VIETHIYIEVTTIEAGLDFYCAGLGLTLKRRFDPKWVELAGANAPIFLVGGLESVAELGKTKIPRDYRRHWTPVHLDFVVADLDDTVERLRARGASLDRPVQLRDYGRMANLADPFGNGFDVIEFSGRGYDGISRG